MNGDSPQSPLDLLIVGGGPTGTAAAWRAHELGMSVLVIDRDCVLSIVKEWGDNQPKSKLVDADYGDWADLVFPSGDALVEQLAYEDQTPADELFTRWMKVYDDNQVPYRNGVELGGCERLPDGVLVAECMDLNTQAKSKVYCRNMVLAMGSGQPAKVRVMGDGLGIRYKLGDANDYVGAPACVVGGGLSAAEAVVAIAIAKATAKDDSDIFWCYRGRSMPKVAKGKALADRFYQAWTGGNIRYMPLSEPLAVFKDDEGTELVAVKTRRLQQRNQPPELICYEFQKKQVLAFIGSERPTELLASMGIAEFSLADAPKKKRLAVTALQETQQKNIFMAGGLLHPAYLQADDFSPDALQSNLKEYSTCFKIGMIEGVRIVETIQQRKKGVDDAAIAKSVWGSVMAASPTPSKPPGQIKSEPAPVERMDGAAFVHIAPGDGGAKTDHFLPIGESVVGRAGGRIVISSDTGLGDTHAAFKVDVDEVYVTNANYGGECYVRINAERIVPVGTILTAGQQLMRIDGGNGKVSLSVIDRAGNVIHSVPLTGDERTIGREQLSPGDYALSREHLAVADKGGVARVRDESRNGTFIVLTGSLRLNEGDEVWMSQQRFRFVELRSEMVQTTGGQTASIPVQEPAAFEGTQAVSLPGSGPVTTPPAAPTPTPTPKPTPTPPTPTPVPTPEPVAAPEPAAAAAGGAVVEGDPKIILPDGTEVAAAGDEELPMLSYMAEEGHAANESEGGADVLWSCWDEDDPTDTGGTCGKCIVIVEEGMQNLSEASSREKNSIKKANKKLGGKLDEDSCRLACQAVCKGPVKIRPKG